MSNLWETDQAQESRIVSPRLELTALGVGDAEEMSSVLGDEDIYEYIGGQPLDLHELRKRYERLVAGPSDTNERWLNWIVRIRPERVAVGTVQATMSHMQGPVPVATIAWVIGASFQRRGYATEATQALVRWLVAQGVGEITAHIHPSHHASIAVARRAGLRMTDDAVDGEAVWLLRTT